MDLYEWVESATCMDEMAEDAAWIEIERKGWVPTPELLFALKAQILEQMMGG